MTGRRVWLTAFAALCVSSTAWAQERPDFSGEWAVEQPAGGRGRGGPAANMGSGWGRSITITQTTDTLFVEYAFFSRGDLQPPLRFRYALDGSRTVNSVMMGRGMQERVSVTSRDGATFVIATSHEFTDPATGRPATVGVTRRLSLDSSSRLVVQSTVENVRGGPPTTTETIYTRN